MDTAWKDMFAPWILTRGQKYYAEGKISQLKQEGNFIFANVAGTEVYNIEIELPNGSANYMVSTWIGTTERLPDGLQALPGSAEPWFLVFRKEGSAAELAFCNRPFLRKKSKIGLRVLLFREACAILALSKEREGIPCSRILSIKIPENIWSAR